MNLHYYWHTYTGIYTCTIIFIIYYACTCTCYFDSVITVGGDGLFNEVINGLLLSTQQQSGVNMRRPQFSPVTPNIRVGVIPTGRNNSIARSVFQCRCPITAAAQIMLGECVCVCVCSV